MFEHYVVHGAAAGLSPTPLFDPAYVGSQADGPAPRDVFEFVVDPRFRHVDPHPLFSKHYYAAINTDVAAAGFDPFFHFAFHGWKERRSIHPFLQQHDYVAQIPPECDRRTFDRHFAAVLDRALPGLGQPLFDASHYLGALAAAEPVGNPLEHFLRTGWKLGLSAFPLFDPEHYLRGGTGSGRNPYVDYLSDFTHAVSPGPSFDASYYSSQAAVPPSFQGSLLEHFVRFGAAQGARPRRDIVVTTTPPGARSGLEMLHAVRTGSGNRTILCGRKPDAQLAADVEAMRAFEPALGEDYLERCGLHACSGPLAPADRSAVALASRIARCNCLLVAAADPAPGLVDGLFSPALSLMHSARPWLTLLLLSRPAVRYRHLFHGCKLDIDVALPDDPAARLQTVGETVVAALPEQLVVNTDPPGTALLRRYATRLLAAVPKVSLLLDGEPASEDRQWLVEFIATSYKDLHLLIGGGTAAARLLAEAGLGMGGDDARVVHLRESA